MATQQQVKSDVGGLFIIALIVIVIWTLATANHGPVSSGPRIILPPGPTVECYPGAYSTCP